MQHILLFSDPHGRIALLLGLAWLFQERTQQPVDLLLVTGDLGVWPEVERLDASTRSYALKKGVWEELGFQCFEPLLPSQACQATGYAKHQRREREFIEAALDALSCDLVFIGGNHEDYAYLQECRKLAGEGSGLVPVEAGGRIFWLPPGRSLWQGDLHISGISGIDAASCGRNPKRYHPLSRVDEPMLLELLEQLEGGPQLDVFLSHDGPPEAAIPGQGSPLLQDALEWLQPQLHFFGHYHRSVEPVSYAQCYGGFEQQATLGVHINKLAFQKQGPLRQRCMYHLQCPKAGELKGRFVEASGLGDLREDRWLRDFKRLL